MSKGCTFFPVCGFLDDFLFPIVGVDAPSRSSLRLVRCPVKVVVEGQALFPDGPLQFLVLHVCKSVPLHSKSSSSSFSQQLHCLALPDLTPGSIQDPLSLSFSRPEARPPIMQSVFQTLASIADGYNLLDDDKPGWDPRHKRFDGPWLQQQLGLSISIGLFCFFLFSFIRRRSPALFAPRTKLKGFTPHTQGIDDGYFSWIWPTIKAEEIKILHIVGLDAAILLSFFKMSFWLFFFLSLW